MNNTYIEDLLELVSVQSDRNESNIIPWIVIARMQETDLRREEIRLPQEESLADGIRVHRGEDVVRDNKVQMVILVVIVETRIDIDHTIREDAVAETIEE